MKDKQLNVRLDSSDFELIITLCSKYGISQSDLIKQLLFTFSRIDENVNDDSAKFSFYDYMLLFHVTDDEKYFDLAFHHDT